MRNNQPVTDNEYVISETDYLISRTDLKGRITYANPSFIEVSGFSKEELIGAPHNIVRHPDMPSEAFDDLWKSLKAGQTWTGLVKNRRKNGDFYWVLATVNPTLENGKVVGYTSLRLKPRAGEVEAATAAYAKFRAGRARGLRIRQGQLQRTGPRGWLRLLKLTSISARLTGMIVTGALLLLAVGGLGLFGMQASNQKLASVYHGSMVPVGLLNTIGAKLDRNAVLMSNAISNPNFNVQKDNADEIVQNNSDIDQLWAQFAPTVSSDLKPEADRFNVIRKRFNRDGVLKLVAALRSASPQSEQLYTQAVQPAYGPLRDELNSLVRLELTQADYLDGQAQRQFRLTRAIMLGGVLAGVVLLVLLGTILRRSIVKPLAQALDASKQIATGNLLVSIASQRRDEVGRLLFGMGAMKNSLLNIVSDVRGGIDAIDTAAREISAGNTDLSARTEQQAASLEETASSMEELTATVKQNA
ncbi:Tar ligand binding domain-containing protein, partial [Pandoraea sp.]|uniref:methyl-accepting chemotaxis protein n=1 Tax=Pandoraea sp. TaxID=1883445 RepID=UPI00120465D4